LGRKGEKFKKLNGIIEQDRGIQAGNCDTGVIGTPQIYTYTIYTPNLGFEIVVFDQEREQGRF